MAVQSLVFLFRNKHALYLLTGLGRAWSYQTCPSWVVFPREVIWRYLSDSESDTRSHLGLVCLPLSSPVLVSACLRGSRPGLCCLVSSVPASCGPVAAVNWLESIALRELIGNTGEAEAQRRAIANTSLGRSVTGWSTLCTPISQGGGILHHPGPQLHP